MIGVVHDGATATLALYERDGDAWTKTDERVVPIYEAWRAIEIPPDWPPVTGFALGIPRGTPVYRPAETAPLA